MKVFKTVCKQLHRQRIWLTASWRTSLSLKSITFSKAKGSYSYYTNNPKSQNHGSKCHHRSKRKVEQE